MVNLSTRFRSNVQYSIPAPTTTRSRRMSSSNYGPLPQEGTSLGDTVYEERAPTHSRPVRPAIYYGEDPFDPPSSEDEDESLLRKEITRSLGMIERAGYAEPGATVCLSPSSL
jgi:hypothetical protein